MRQKLNENKICVLRRRKIGVRAHNRQNSLIAYFCCLFDKNLRFIIAIFPAFAKTRAAAIVGAVPRAFLQEFSVSPSCVCITKRYQMLVYQKFCPQTLTCTSSSDLKTTIFVLLAAHMRARPHFDHHLHRRQSNLIKRSRHRRYSIGAEDAGGSWRGTSGDEKRDERERRRRKKRRSRSSRWRRHFRDLRAAASARARQNWTAAVSVSSGSGSIWIAHLQATATALLCEI